MGKESCLNEQLVLVSAAYILTSVSELVCTFRNITRVTNKTLLNLLKETGKIFKILEESYSKCLLEKINLPYPLKKERAIVLGGPQEVRPLEEKFLYKPHKMGKCLIT